MVAKSFLLVTFLAAIAGAAPTQEKRAEAANLYTINYDEDSAKKRAEAANLYTINYDEDSAKKRAEAANLYTINYDEDDTV